MSNETNKGRAVALLPILVFLVIFLGSGIITGDFYAMPAIVAFLVALCVAFVQNKGLSFDEKISVIAKGVGDDNIITLAADCHGLFPAQPGHFIKGGSIRIHGFVNIRHPDHEGNVEFLQKLLPSGGCGC